jgi:acetyl-CoA carboxylase carboxyl transferase subunit alpha
MDYTNKIKKTIKSLEQLSKNQGIDLNDEINSLEKKLADIYPEQDSHYQEEKKQHTPWERVKIARNLERPKPQDFIENMIKDFIPFHGDRLIGDDNAIMGGIGYLKDIPVTAIGTRRGKDLKGNMDSNFGMPHPEGYRKALRLARQAEKFRRPVIFFVDTPGAFCGLEAEERGMAEAIARNLFELSDLNVPTFTVITGEGGSGGALALSVSNKIYMMENAILSVISPEGCASIIFKDSARAEEAASSLRLTAFDLFELGIIDKIVEEDKDFESNLKPTLDRLEEMLYDDVFRFSFMDEEKMKDQRYNKYRSIGFFEAEKAQIPEKLLNAANGNNNGNMNGKNNFLNEVARFFGLK